MIQGSTGNNSWEQCHTQALTREMIKTLLSSRPNYYRAEGLAGEVDNNYGNRISAKVVQACEKMARDAGLDPRIVKEETKKKSDSPAGKVKAKNGEASPKKKRKVKDEEEDGTTGSD